MEEDHAQGSEVEREANAPLWTCAGAGSRSELDMVIGTPDSCPLSVDYLSAFPNRAPDT